MNQKLSSPLLIRVFVLGGAVGFAAGIASARKIKEMMPKIIALAANEYVKGKVGNIKDKVTDRFHAVGTGTRNVTKRIKNRATTVGHNVAEGTGGLMEKASEKASKKASSVRNMLSREEQHHAAKPRRKKHAS